MTSRGGHSAVDAAPARVLLAIETSCDETAAAVIDERLTVRSSVVASQHDLHLRFGGVVPEVASRAHVRCILPVVDEALSRASVSLDDLCAIAVVTEPGLVGSLLVGLTAAKTLAMALRVPLVPVDHLAAHLFACRLANPDRQVFPAIGLVVSGGHSNLYDCGGDDFTLIGATIDDAAGEAFDKVAKILGLPYPGGPSIERAARGGDPRAFNFPRSFLHDERLAFSFSGLKTAVLYEVQGTPGSRTPAPPLTEQRVADLAASFQAAVIDALVAKCRQALISHHRMRLCVGGGVSANALLRERLSEMTAELGAELILAPKEYCTDNAAMAALAWEALERGRISPLDIDVTPGLIRRK
jgi:N6-L-threonylcarbamoyladenine synthase